MKLGTELREIPERCSFKPLVGGVAMSTTPQAGLGMGTIMVGTPGSKSDTPPPAESTRKTATRQLGPDLGESYIQPKPGPMPRVGIVTGTPDTTANTPSSYQLEYTQETPYHTPNSSVSHHKHEVSSPESEDTSPIHKEDSQQQLIEEEKEQRLLQLERERQDREAQDRRLKQKELLEEKEIES